MISGIHPAAVNCPVSASLVGKSSHVKLSVRSIVRSILRCWILRKRKQIIIKRRKSAEMYNKNLTEGLVFYFENEILPKQASETWTLNVVSGLMSNNITVLSLFRTFNRQDILSLLRN
jgi:hypothetical protein